MTASNQIFSSPGNIYRNLIGDVNGATSPSAADQIVLYKDSSGKSLKISNGEIKSDRINIAGIELEGKADNNVIIYKESDFPAPIAGVITLEVNKSYIIKKDISTSNRFVIPSASSTSIIGGSPGGFPISIQYSGTLTFITSVDFDNVFINSLNLTSNSTGTLFNIVGDFQSNIFSVTFCSIDGWDNIGTIDKTLIFGINRCQFVDNPNGIILKNIQQITIDTSTFSNTISGGTYIEIDTSVNANIRNIILNMIAADTFLDVKSTISGSAKFKIIENSRNNLGLFFSVAGIDQTDPRMNVKDCDFQKNSFTLATSFSTDNTTLIVISTIDTYVNMDFTSSVVSEGSNNERFTVDDSKTGEMKYIGVQDLSANVTCSISATGTTGSQKYQFRVVKNGVVLPDVIVAEMDLTSIGDNVTLLSPITLVTNDLIRIQVQNVEGTDNITVEQYSFKIQ